MKMRARKVNAKMARRKAPIGAKWNHLGKWFDPKTGTIWYKDLRSFYENS